MVDARLRGSLRLECTPPLQWPTMARGVRCSSRLSEAAKCSSSCLTSKGRCETRSSPWRVPFCFFPFLLFVVHLPSPGLCAVSRFSPPSLLQTYHKPVWLEINGHAVNVFNGQRDPAPAIRFDLRETRIMAAVRGQPRANIDTQAPVLAIVSRYFVDERTGDCCFFFQTQNESDKQEWIK